MNQHPICVFSGVALADPRAGSHDLQILLVRLQALHSWRMCNSNLNARRIPWEYHQTFVPEMVFHLTYLDHGICILALSHGEKADDRMVVLPFSLILLLSA
uniref:Uncharacterized protein n=1 Tax=Hanusia phi TaxID=3032 RepID=A0A7S0E007_9CRYP|mmetsp:Transcript_13066/g.30051  ORF Transcript_13066/g.30051 Transcript_13066/m.30051 type:complete len:101 (+) Transcript_13066:346-648(+)